ncbi:Intracellular protein transporter USO1-like protein [Quillaja saponaria]|nr:Intracellular protein transporter USO1-like protein [Quillaja saponaria]
MAPYNPAEAPNSSLHHKGRMGESSYNLQTSAELLKVLNRIWSLEEQHASNISLVKALKMELGYYQARVKELLREKQSDRQEMDNLIKKKYTEDKLLRKIQEQDRIIAAVQSVKQELEDERKLRKRSESLHRKLARELSAIKSSFSDALRELERERKARILLESLCDEFSRGIRDYEQVLRSLRQKPEKGQVGGESLDRLILHISEAWLDERMQMKLSEPGKDLAERNTIVDKLRFDIETFLQAKQSVDLKKYSNLSPKELKEVYSHRNSSESSFPLKEAISAPQNVAGEEDSTDSDSNFEPKKTTGNKNSKGSFRKQGNNAAEGHREGNKNSNSMRRKVGQEKTTQVGDQSVERKPSNIGGEQPAAVNDNEISKICDTTEIVEDRPIKRSGSYQSNSNHVPDNLIRNHSLSSEGVQIHPESNCKENSSIQSVVTGNASPAQQWMSKLKFPDTEKSETSLKWPTGIKENTLMAKLLEARFERQQTRSKACKGSL